MFIKKWLSLRYSVEIIVSLVLLAIAQTLVLYFYQYNRSTTELVVKAFLEKSELSLNPYKASQTLDSLEALGLIRCTQMFVENEQRPFYDSNNFAGCNYKFLLPGSFAAFHFKSGNGQNSFVNTFTTVNIGTFWLLVFLRMLSVVVGFLVVRQVKWRFRAIEESKNVELARAAATAAMSKQISHDIRSPLSALNMVLSTLEDLPEDKRLMIRNATQRINDIANGLLGISKAKRKTGSASSPAEPIMISAQLDSIVSEKRMQFREQLQIEIQAQLDHGYGLFAFIDATEFSRMISNLVDNAVESIQEAGKVSVSVSSTAQEILLEIRDTGRGIPSHILSQIGTEGFSHGKSESRSGSGLGVFHALQTAEKAAGNLTINSEVDFGTTILITLPKAPMPPWFLKELNVNETSIVVSADDDKTIHQVWEERFANAGGVEKHVSLSSLESLETWVKAHPATNATYLIDYEFLGQRGSGLDMIEKLGLGKSAILVTSRFDDSRIQKRAQQLGVAILPKSLGPIVPIINQNA